MAVSRPQVPAWVSLPFVADEHARGVTAFLLVYAYLLRDVAVGRVFAFGDLPPYYGTRALAKFASTWHDGGLGYAYDYHALPAYLGAVTLVGDLPLVPAGGVDLGALAGNVFFLGLVPVGFVGFLRFSTRYVDSVLARYAGAFCYALNPVVLAEFVNGGTTALVAFAGLPFVLDACWTVAERNAWRAALVAAAAFGVMAVSPWIAFWFVAPFGAVVVWRARGSPDVLTKLAAAGALGTVLTLPGLHHVLQRASGLDGNWGALRGTLRWNYAEATPLPLLRLAGNKGTIAMNAFGYNDVGAYPVGLVIPLVALLAWRRRDLRPFYAVVGALVGFLVATKHGYTYPLFETLPPLYSVRNPAKLQFPLAFALALLLGAGTETLLARVRRLAAAERVEPFREAATLSPSGACRVASVAVTAVLVLSLVAYVAPASGAFGLETVRGDDYYVSDAEASVADRLDGRVLWAPYGYTTQLHLRHVYPAHVGVRSGAAFQGIQNVDYVRALFDAFAADPASVRAQLDSMDVRYVVVSRDPPDRVSSGPPRRVNRYGAPWLVGNPAAFERALDRSAVFERAFETESHVAYRVEGVEATPRTERVEGVHAVYYPQSTDGYPPSDREYVSNANFSDGLSGWWAAGQSTVYSVLRTDGGFGTRAVRLRAVGSPPSPIAQRVAVPSVPLLLNVRTSDSVEVTLAWFDGTGPNEEPVSVERLAGTEFPRVVSPNGSAVGIRIRPVDGNATVHAVSLTPAREPPATAFVQSTAGVPGVAVDGRERGSAGATTVAVNLPPRAAARVGADVRIVDAETRIGGRIVFDDRYRQGAALALTDGHVPAAVPDDAQLVIRPGPDGAVLDYWVVGRFGDRSVTVHRTSYHRRWTASDAVDHVRADGWANGFVGTDAESVEWGGLPVRTFVVVGWLGSWLAVVVALVRPPRSR